MYNLILLIYMGNFSLIYAYMEFNPLNAELNPLCHLLALLGTHHILHVSRIRVNTMCEYLQVFQSYVQL